MINVPTSARRSLFAALWVASIGFVGLPTFAQPTEAFAASAEANTGGAPAEFVVTLVDDLKSLAASSGDGDAARNEGFRQVLSEDMAIRRMKAFLLSRKLREEASDEHMTAYDTLFNNYITAAYASEIDELVSRTLKITDVVVRRPGDYIVRSKLFNDDGEERAGVDWRVLDVSDDLRLVDVMVDGLSFNVERRAQFTSIIQKDGFDALIDHMQGQIDGMPAAGE
ncbi:MAG: ABC transporter substrate-binding protein [Pseudomonadota bacterium]